MKRNIVKRTVTSLLRLSLLIKRCKSAGATPRKLIAIINPSKKYYMLLYLTGFLYVGGAISIPNSTRRTGTSSGL